MMEWKRYLKKEAPPAAGSGTAEPFDTGRAAVEIQRLVKEVSAVQVPGGWDRVKVRRAEEWRRLQAAMVAVDDSYSRRDAAGVNGAISEARRVVIGFQSPLHGGEGIKHSRDD
ncbi:hypothetical protein [Geobacter sp.]|uniref:hypothetical protein n=1 Tax=Geobacter sp. TaxID=46610 RepID=UPI001AC37086|nr:hypothetical protein [Geobacter sp.]CAG0940945.1 hypothetical protein ANRL1_00321 [Anaerolineae bacterium]